MGNARLWSYPLDRTGTNLGNPRPLTPPEMSADGLDLSADGTNLVFLLHRPGSSEPLEWRERRMPEGPEHYLLSMDQAHGERRGPVVWSRDGRRVAYRYIAPRSAAFESGASILYNAPQSIRVLDTRTGDDFPLTSTAPLLEFPTGWSTDGLSVPHEWSALPRTGWTSRPLSHNVAPLDWSLSRLRRRPRKPHES